MSLEAEVNASVDTVQAPPHLGWQLSLLLGLLTEKNNWVCVVMELGCSRAGCGVVELGVGLWSWVWGCCGAGCGKHSAVGCPCHRETLSIFFGRVTGNAISYWSPLCLSYLEISLVISERGRREAEQVECLCTMSNTKTAVTRKCPHRSANTSLAMMVVETDRWWWMTVVMSLVQLPWFTPCPENT